MKEDTESDQEDEDIRSPKIKKKQKQLNYLNNDMT